jgi:hypothetical protein
MGRHVTPLSVFIHICLEWLTLPYETGFRPVGKLTPLTRSLASNDRLISIPPPPNQPNPIKTAIKHIKQEQSITREQAALAEEAKARQREFDEQVQQLNARVRALEEKVRGKGEGGVVCVCSCVGGGRGVVQWREGEEFMPPSC